MLKDITLGQYFYRDSPIHRLDPRTKLLFTLIFIVLLFTCRNFVSLGLMIALCAVLFFVAKIPVKLVLKSIKPILPIVVFTSILNLFFVSGDPIAEFWGLHITYQGLYFALMITLRIVALIACSSLLTYTTSPIALTDAIERLLRPLGKIKVPVHELAMMMTIALRFIPTLIEETDKIMSAQKSRGAGLDTGKFIEKVKALVPVLVPLFISAFRRADELALAMECRCYRGGEGRTRLKQLRFLRGDAVALVVCVAAAASVITLNIVLPSVL